MASEPGTTSNTPKLPEQPKALAELLPVSFAPGQIIQGRYELIRLLGTGGVGFVVAAHHAGFDDLVALKFLRPEFTTNVEAVSRFTIEARASFRLRSEHVARVLDVDVHEGTPFIAMELLEGTDMRGLLERARVIDTQPAVDYMLQVCEALAAAHAIGVIHRDIKPENLFLLGDGADGDHLKVLDFGISKVALITHDRTTHQALTRVAVGTPPYMSPEQVRAARDLDGRSDIWSVGCVLYELVTGTSPFERLSLMQSCAAVLEEVPVPPHELRHAVPAAVSDAIMRCLHKDPEQRWPDVAELAEALAPFGSGRFAAYPGRCRSHLSGEGVGRRSTPSSLTGGLRRVTGTIPGAGVRATPTGAHAIAVRLDEGLQRSDRQSGADAIQAVSAAPSTQLAVRRPTPTAPQHAGPAELATLPHDVPKHRTARLLALGAALMLVLALAAHFATRERVAKLQSAARPRAMTGAEPTFARAAPLVDLVEEPTEVLPQLPSTLHAEPLPSPSTPTSTAATAAISGDKPSSLAKAATAAVKPRKPSTHAATTTTKPVQAPASAGDPDVGF
ncbi:MAG: protein kinase [Polyangiales bacterium]